MGIKQIMSIVKCQLSNVNCQLGFTMIELVVVIGILLITLPITFGLFFVTFQAQSRVFVLQEVKRNGDIALNIIEHLIRNRAYAIYLDSGMATEVCSTKSGVTTPYQYSSGTLYFKDKDGKRFYFAISNNQIASYSAIINPDPYIITNRKVKVTNSNFSITCQRPSDPAIYSPPIVTIKFKVENTTGIRYEEIANLTYETKIKLRSY